MKILKKICLVTSGAYSTWDLMYFINFEDFKAITSLNIAFFYSHS